jgi:hypothetical protein
MKRTVEWSLGPSLRKSNAAKILDSLDEVVGVEEVVTSVVDVNLIAHLLVIAMLVEIF